MGLERTGHSVSIPGVGAHPCLPHHALPGRRRAAEHATDCTASGTQTGAPAAPPPRAYASVSRGGVAVTPYGIRRVTTADGTLLYQHPTEEPRVLVAPWVAAQMTELLQGVVEHGTGRDAALGRPTAGKTGTTSSNKDGWFIGFSSGLTTGVWMGRDDNRALPGLTGGHAPARAFHDLMARAVANRPVEQFQLDATGPEWDVQGGDN